MSPSPVSLDRFNGADPGELHETLRACVSSDAWAGTVLAGRPYTSVDDLADAAARAVLTLDRGEIDEALAGHPRIGERHAGAGPSGFSADEQSGVAETAADRLAEANARYERRFGHVFLIRAAGRDADEVLAELERRITNPPDDERTEAAGQLAEITALRLRRTVIA